MSTTRAMKGNERVHRERAQPASRAHLGFLEKKKDYKKRATDHHEKTATIKKLRKEALDKNADEYHHHMVNSRVEKDGRHVEKMKADEDTELQKKLGSIKDLEYVKYHLNKERKKIDELKSVLHLAGAGLSSSSKHTVFVEDNDEAKQFDPVEFLSTDDSLVGRKWNVHRKDDLVHSSIKGASSYEDIKNVEKLRREQYKELRKRMHREKELRVVVEKLELKKNLANSNTGELKPKRIKAGKSDRAAVYEWTYVRKR